MELGRLETVPARTIGTNEARDFTPWLLANADRLGEALGVELELTNAEHPVGGYSLDLVGRDLTNDAVLIVENQLEGTDHSHLGQILTYTAGTGASTIVWLAASFREEHRQALDWLNEQTAENIHFFASTPRRGRLAGPRLCRKVVATVEPWTRCGDGRVVGSLAMCPSSHARRASPE